MRGGRERQPGRFRRSGNNGGRPATPALVMRLLRDAYASPEDPAYWDRLEARILARLQPAQGWTVDGWSVAFGAWARAGLAAACVAVLAAGLAAWTSRNTEARVAYETVLEGPTAVPVLTNSRFINVSVQEATERYVLSH
jgi:hypothetical protein